MKNIAVIIPSYKNELWCEKNLQSVLSQNYSNFRVIFTDDCSSDKTVQIVENFVLRHNVANKVKIIKNNERLGAMHNLYNMIHSCDDNEIVLTLDGDDWFAHPNVLKKINDVYSEDGVCMAYGSYIDFPNNSRGCCRPYERNVVDLNTFRHVPWRASHLRTFYVWLFKKIKKEDFYDPQGKFLDMAWDLSFMLPMLEMSGPNHRYVHEILYVYNNENPISDYKVNQGRQAAMDKWIRTKPKYSKI